MATAIATEPQAKVEPLTPEMVPPPGDVRFEFLNGEWKEKISMGAEANLILTKLIVQMCEFAMQHNLGLCFSAECGYQCFPHAPRQVRYPDGSFVKAGRLPGDKPPRGHMRIPPDLAIEVVSPNDLAEDLEARIEDYFRAGVPLIWVLYPTTRRVYVLHPNGTAARLGPEADLSGEEVIPGFQCGLAELFAVIGSAPEAEPTPESS